MVPDWIAQTIKEQQNKKAHGRITLHIEHGEITRAVVEQSIRRPEKNKPKK